MSLFKLTTHNTHFSPLGKINWLWVILTPKVGIIHLLYYYSILLVQYAEDIISSLGNATRTQILKNSDLSTQPILEVISLNTPKINTKNSKSLILENLSHIPLTVDELLRACHLNIPAEQFCTARDRTSKIDQPTRQPCHLA